MIGRQRGFFCAGRYKTRSSVSCCRRLSGLCGTDENLLTPNFLTFTLSLDFGLVGQGLVQYLAIKFARQTIATKDLRQEVRRWMVRKLVACYEAMSVDCSISVTTDSPVTVDVGMAGSIRRGRFFLRFRKERENGRGPWVVRFPDPGKSLSGADSCLLRPTPRRCHPCRFWIT
jgi:hypothetical protein